MANKENEADALRQALNNWPAIQKHLLEEAANDALDEDGNPRDPYEPYWTTEADGTRVLHASPDAWWLKDYDESAVLINLGGVSIFHTKPFHVNSVVSSIYQAYGANRWQPSAGIFSEADVLAHIEGFPEGQFAAQRTGGPGAGACIGMAATMRTSRPPTAPPLPWLEAIGDMRLSAHEPNGDWLYGVEMAVWPMYRRSGIGSGLYAARFALVQHLNLCGMYAVGMLMGYHQHADEMDVIAYGNKVIAGEIKDPTVTMQLNRGFRAERVVTDYCDEPAAGDAGVLLVWENPEYEA